jgi:hypothetical protein
MHLRPLSWLAVLGWGVLLASAVIGRESLDWLLAPTDDFYARSVVSTAIAAAIFAAAGGWAAWRSGSIVTSIAAGMAVGGVSAIIVIGVSVTMLAIWHDPHTMAMIRASGGIGEVFLLPTLVIVPGTVCALAGGVIGRLARQ